MKNWSVLKLNPFIETIHENVHHNYWLRVLSQIKATPNWAVYAKTHAWINEHILVVDGSASNGQCLHNTDLSDLLSLGGRHIFHFIHLFIYFLVKMIVKKNHKK